LQEGVVNVTGVTLAAALRLPGAEGARFREWSINCPVKLPRDG
jgi:hypothetical protein